MNAFVRHRRSLRLCASFLSLNQIFDVDVVFRVASYETIMTRNDFYDNDENEFLQYCDAVIDCSSASFQWVHDFCAEAHLLTEIEPAELQEINKKYSLQDMTWYDDLRLTNLIQAIHILATNETGIQSDADSDEDGLEVIDKIHKKLSQLLYVPRNEIVVTRFINEYGIDSMIAAELKNWLYKNFAIDKSLFKLLDPTTTVMNLAAEIGQDSWWGAGTCKNKVPFPLLSSSPFFSFLVYDKRLQSAHDSIENVAR